MAEQNLVKNYLRCAGFKVKLMQGPQPVTAPAEPDNIEDILEGA